VRAKVEHPFRILKRIFGFEKVRYRGIEKNHHRLCTLGRRCHQPDRHGSRGFARTGRADNHGAGGSLDSARPPREPLASRERECTSQTSGDEERLTIYRCCTAKSSKLFRENQMFIVIVGGVPHEILSTMAEPVLI
jgi:hypothetical protein